MAKKKAAKAGNRRSPKKASPPRKARRPAEEPAPRESEPQPDTEPAQPDTEPAQPDTDPVPTTEDPDATSGDKSSPPADSEMTTAEKASTTSPDEPNRTAAAETAGEEQAGSETSSKPARDDFSISDLPDEIRRRLSLQDEADQNVIDKFAAVLGWVIFVFVSFTLIWGTYQLFGGGPSDLLIEAAWVKTDEGSSQIHGRVTLDHEPISEASIQILVLDDQQGARPTFLRSESDGTFVGYADGEIAYIDAAIRKWWWIRTKTARKTLTPDAPFDATASKREVVGGFAVGAVLLLWFMASVLVALMVTPRFARRAKIKYYVVAFMAFAFPIFVASAFAIAQSRLVTDGETHEGDRIVSLGVATVFKGTYSAEVEEEWLISLTLPPKPDETGISDVNTTPTQAAGNASLGAGNASQGAGNASQGAGTASQRGSQGAGTATSAQDPGTNAAALDVENNNRDTRRVSKKNVVKGFGAPLWVLFIAVLGAGLSTFSLIIREIDEPPDFEDFADLRDRIHKMVEHEFYIFFAPVGGAFVYQLMVLTNAANEPVMVAIAALGAGVSVQSILRRAVRTARAIAEDEGTSAGARNAAAKKATTAKAAS